MVDTLKLIKYNDPILHSPCNDWDFTNPPFDLPDFAEQLVATMRAENGLGLAANQVGVPYKIFALESEPTYVVINPKILEISPDDIELEEGCLSYKGLFVKVKRPLWIKVRFNYPNGEAGTHRFEGITARAFLHEYSHIEYGETMLDRLHPIHREKADRQWKKILRARKNS